MKRIVSIISMTLLFCALTAWWLVSVSAENKYTATIAPTTADSTVDFLVGASATTSTPLAVQLKASATAAALEIQKSDGTSLLSITPVADTYVQIAEQLYTNGVFGCASSFRSSSNVGFTTSVAGAVTDVGFARLAADVMQVNGGEAGGDGWLQQTAGRKRRTATQTVTDSTTLTADDTLVVTVLAGRAYSFRIKYFFTTVATSGAKLDLGGGTCTFTSLSGSTWLYHTSVSTPSLASTGSVFYTSSTTAVGATTAGTSTVVEMEGCFVCNAGGTFVPRFAQNAETGAGESVIANINSFMWVEDMP